MAIYQNGNKPGNLIIRGASVNKAYLGGKEVYSKTPIIDNSYIEIEIDSSSGTFIVPLSAHPGNKSQFHLNIFVNSEFITDYEFTCNYLEGTGYELIGLTGNTARIRISPADGSATIGWGRCFGFYSDTNGCNTIANKAKVLHIINDTDWAHLESETNTGHYFRFYQYYGCTNLTTPVIETLPDSITKVGNNFRGYQYYGCTKLITTTAEVIPDSVTSLGEYFREFQYYNCTRITTPAAEVIPDSVININRYFRYSQYRSCTNLTTTVTEVLPDNITSIGEKFRYARYYGCTSMLIGNHIHTPSYNKSYRWHFI
ncbi:MAG: leucine-rich repeat domain-containing protein [Odoribacter sp.]|nr:leucine-rich repeat domain-containing protein [Odoribacter sp.]